MRFAQMMAGAAVAAVATMVAMALPAAAATPVNYAALGDSYSSGDVTDNYYSSSGSCDRSPQGYPALWVASHTVSNFDFAACSGAQTADVINSQLGGLSASTNLVSITIGGNDAGFSSVMTTCITGSDSDCYNAVTSAENFANTTLRGRLDTTYADIRSHAPNAHVVVLGYPRFYQVPGGCWLGLDDTKRTYIDGGSDTLDSVASQEVAKYSNFTWADVRGAFSAHEICSTQGAEWLHSLDWFNFNDSYHPTADGYSGGYYPVLHGVTG
jgi:lysophospholipase L1-like esterase